jgi:hypothetical protein
MNQSLPRMETLQHISLKQGLLEAKQFLQLTTVGGELILYAKHNKGGD